jgi:outer membrane immunogenic protein
MRDKFGAAAIAALVCAAGSAMAADLPVKAPAPVYGWAGFYLGADIGGFGASQSATTNPFPSPGFGAPAVLGAGVPGFGNLPTHHDLGDAGALGAIHAGYNWQMSNWVVGVEGDIALIRRNVTDIEAVTQTFATGPAFNMQVVANNDWLASARGRLGWTGGSWLLYATGGAAWTSTSYSATATGLTNLQAAVALPTASSGVSFDETRTGWVAGLGLEWMLSPNWIVRAEYLHYDFGGSSATLPLVFTQVSPPAACGPGQCNWAVSTSNLHLDTGRLGLSYKF